jgi:hypothetical protein
MELSAYLHYRGLNVVRTGGAAGAPGTVVLIEAPAPFPHNRCVDYQVYQCLETPTPPPGALLIVLPDDDVSMAEVNDLKATATPIIAEDQCPLCSWAHPWFRALYAASAMHSQGRLPDHWLHFDVLREGAPPSSAHTRS